MRLRVAIVSIAIVLFWCGQGFAASVKPDLVVLLFGSELDPRPIAVPGQPFSFRIGLDNMTAADAHEVKLTALLPKGFNFRTSDPAPTKVENENHLTWELNSPDPKTLPRFFDVTLETEANLVPGTEAEISAQVECSEAIVDPAHNRATQTVYVQAAGPRLVLSGSTFDSVILTAEEPVTFQIKIENAGNLPAIDTRMQATVPAGLKLVKAEPASASSTGNTVTFKLGDLARAESKSISMKVAFDPLQLSDLLSKDTPLTFAFRASRVASGAEVTDSQIEITKHIESAGHDVALWLMKESANKTEKSSLKGDMTCVIKLANLGNQPAHKVSVTLSLGPGLDIAHSDPPASTSAKSADPLVATARWDIGDLEIGMSRTIHSVIHNASTAGDGVVLAAAISADGLDIDSTNNTASLVLYNPSSASTIKSARSTPELKPVGRSEKSAGRPVSHHWRHLLELILVIIAVAIVFRARHKR